MPRDQPDYAKRWAAIAHCEIGDDGVLALASSPHLSALRTLQLDYAVCADRALETLMASPMVARLVTLGMHCVPLAPSVIAALCGNAGSLRALGLTLCGIDDAAAEQLVGCAAMPQIERLIVPLGKLTARGVRTLVDADWPRLHTIDLSGHRFDEPVVRAIADARGMPVLRRMILDDRSEIDTGEIETWYDQGIECGSGPVYLDLPQIRRTYLAGARFEIASAWQARSWPGELWL